MKKHQLSAPEKRHRNRKCRLSDSEVMTILVIFHTKHFRGLKSFYIGYVCHHMRNEFPNTVSYNRFVERQSQVLLHLLLFLQTCALGKCTGISIIDSTLLVSCHIKREKQHKTLLDLLFVDDIHVITKIKKNMKNSLMHLYDKLLLRKRALIETVNDELKNICQIEHTRHRSVDNFATNLVAGLIAYNLLPKKPSMNIEIIDKSRILG